MGSAIPLNNRCAYCKGMFGLVRHRRGYRCFCSQKCVDQFEAWLQAEVHKRKGWSDCLWAASSSVEVYACNDSLFVNRLNHLEQQPFQHT
jgi:hypothetical protein